MAVLWRWVEAALFVRLFTDGEPRYANCFWQLAHVWLGGKELPQAYGQRKVLREGSEVASKVKRSQGRRRVHRRKPEHPYTALSAKSEVHANHCEAHNSSIRRRCSAYRRRQNHYAKTQAGLNRAITALRLIHNWVRPHCSLPKATTPAMAMGFIDRPLTLAEMLSCRDFHDLN
ncbi:hypothetical protein [Synechococcus sp. PCC 7336]|uniref:hypothetical protein n=1 Tax=Synechococcus sp. PCC 7336 TaxID=195250 RepID=UPI0008FBD6C4